MPVGSSISPLVRSVLTSGPRLLYLTASHRLIAGLLFAAAIAATSAPPLASQVPPPTAVPSAPASDQDDANDKRWRAQRCLLGLSYGSPLKLHVAAAAGLRRAFDSRSVCSYGAVHLGLGGARASLGTAATFGRYGSGLGVSGGILRTFGNPGGDADPRRSYLGGSVHLWPLLALHTELGAYSRIARDGESAQRILVWSVGFGY